MVDSQPGWMEQLYELSLEVLRARRRWVGSLGLTIEDVAGDFLIQRGEKLRGKDYAEAQLRRAVIRFLVDVQRRRDRDPERPGGQALVEIATARSPELASPAPVLAYPEAVALMAAVVPAAGKLDYGAVLLLSERVQVLRAAADLVRQGELPPPPSTFAERFYPWGAAEVGRRIHARCPPVDEVWSTLAARTGDDPACRLVDDVIAELVGATRAAWYQWRHRAWERFFELHGDEASRKAIPTCRRRKGSRA